jgi:2-amino-4-hydroxy-6-hydroxymethyldihydropteridine diphosphokinase
MARVFVGLGSNLGDRSDFLLRAVEEIKNLKGTVFNKSSSMYNTEPVGNKLQPQFLNMVVELDSALPPRELLQKLKQIERILGRKKAERWGPREIDLDLLYYGGEIMNDAELKLPHPEIAGRRFVLVPMKEIAPDFVDPLRKQTIAELLLCCPDTSAVRKSTRNSRHNDGAPRAASV